MTWTTTQPSASGGCKDIFSAEDYCDELRSFRQRRQADHQWHFTRWRPYPGGRHAHGCSAATTASHAQAGFVQLSDGQAEARERALADRDRRLSEAWKQPAPIQEPPAAQTAPTTPAAGADA